jgi:hypothetical protein
MSRLASPLVPGQFDFASLLQWDHGSRTRRRQHAVNLFSDSRGYELEGVSFEPSLPEGGHDPVAQMWVCWIVDAYLTGFVRGSSGDLPGVEADEIRPWSKRGRMEGTACLKRCPEHALGAFHR